MGSRAGQQVPYPWGCGSALSKRGKGEGGSCEGLEGGSGVVGERKGRNTPHAGSGSAGERRAEARGGASRLFNT